MKTKVPKEVYDLLSEETFRPDICLRGKTLGIDTITMASRVSVHGVPAIGLPPLLPQPQYSYWTGTTTHTVFRPNIRLPTALRMIILALSIVIFQCAAQNRTASAWEDILNGLGTDLAPLLALFGEQVTKQYLGESFSIIDNIIFALAPLGIITVVVSAIRVSGSQALRSIIGRSTESRGVVEADLMSSTSADVCELWNGLGIVRVLGSPLLLQLVFVRPNNSDMPKIFTFQEAVDKKHYKGKNTSSDPKQSLSTHENPPNSDPEQSLSTHGNPPNSDPEQPLLTHENPPNLSLNIDFKSISPWNQAFCVSLGVISQGAVVAFAGLVQFRLQFSEGGFWSEKQQPTHAFWLFLGGTALLTLGAFGCAWVVETSTDEVLWEPAGESIGVVWLQKGGQTVGDQLFESFALQLENPIIWTSEKGKERASRQLLVWIATLGTVVGFIIQFISFRLMNNLITAAQLGAVIIMTATRSWVHIRKENKNDITNPDQVKDHELDWLANNIHGGETWEVITGPHYPDTDGDGSAGQTESPKSPESPESPPNQAEKIMQTRARLAELSRSWELEDRIKVKNLKNAIEETMREVYDKMTLNPGLDISTEFQWSLPVKIMRSPTAETPRIPEKEPSQLPTVSVVYRLFTGVLSLLQSLVIPSRPRLAVQKNSTTELYNISLTLRRKEEESGWTPWIIEEKDLEAVLCLWIHTLSNKGLPKLRVFAPSDDLAAKGDYRLWIHRETTLDEEKLGSKSRCFGWSNTSHKNEYLVVSPKEDIETLCAQEVYRFFMFTLADIIKDVGGDTSLRTSNKKVGLKNFCLYNSNLASLATIYNNFGLGTIEDAYFSIISALRTSDNLPAMDEVLHRIQTLSINDCNIDERKLIGLPIGGIEYNNSRGTVLQDAARAGLEGVVKWLIDSGADLNAPPGWYSGRTALQAAAEGGHEGIVKLLLDGGAVVNDVVASHHGRTALQAAAGGGNGSIVKILLEKGAQVNTVTIPNNISGATVLQAAAAAGHEEICIMLLKAGAYVNAKDHGTTALQAAVEGGHGGIIDVLLKAGAETNTQLGLVSGRTALQAAAKAGDEIIVKTLLGAGENINAVPGPHSGRTALQAAAEGGYKTLVETLLGGGADINALPALYSGRTALQAAAGGGHEDIIDLLLDQAEINALPAPNAGRTALQAAAEGGHENIVKLLLSCNANINAPPALVAGRTALQAAAGGGHEDIVKVLLKAGADVNASPVPNSGRTALQAAAGGGHEDTVKVLLTAGADVNASPSHDSGRTALQAAAEGGHESTIKTLLEAGADVNAAPSEDSGRTALQAAADGGHEGTIKTLLEAGADVNAAPSTDSGRTALQAAASGGHEGIVKILLEAGADVNAAPSEDSGRTALQAAAEGGYEAVVEVLLGHEASLEHGVGQVALEAAVYGGHESVVGLLLNSGVNINTPPGQDSGQTVLRAAVDGGHEGIIKMLLEAGADVNTAPSEDSGRTALQAAAEIGYESIIRFLLGYGAEINAFPAPNSGRTALQAAAGGGHEDIVKVLLKAGADVNASPAQNSGRTALQAVSEAGHKGIIRILLEAGADISAAPAQKSGRTALQAAAGAGYKDIVKLLLGRGADINAPPAPDSGRTALQAAVEGGHEDIIKILLEARADINAAPAPTSGRTALQAAAGTGYKAITELLLGHKANVNALPAPISGRTALQAAAERGHSEIVNLLLRAGANPNALPAHSLGETALRAAIKGHKMDYSGGDAFLEIMGLLVRAGAVKDDTIPTSGGTRSVSNSES